MRTFDSKHPKASPIKRAFAVLIAAALIAVSLAACGGRSSGQSLEKLDKDEIKLVTGLDSIHSSYMYMIEDEEGVAELVDLYNNVRYEPVPEGEEAPQLLLVDLAEGVCHHRREQVFLKWLR